MGEGKGEKKVREEGNQNIRLLKTENRGAWVAQSVERRTSAQVMISTAREFEPRIGLWADSSEPGAGLGFWVSLSSCPSPSHALSLSQK